MRGKITKEELGLKAGANMERERERECGGTENGILNRTFQHLARTEILFAKTASFLLTETKSSPLPILYLEIRRYTEASQYWRCNSLASF